jgi:polysaccharide biosynthesis/export protein
MLPKVSSENTLGVVHPLLASLAVPLAKGNYRGSRGTRFSSVVAPHRGMRVSSVVICLLMLPLLLYSQDQDSAPPSGPATPSVGEEPSAYILGPGDTITIRALNVEEISEKPVRIGTSGVIKFPMIGRIEAAGMTLEQLEAEIINRLKDSVNEPDVAVAITEYRSQPVSIMGSVNTPGVLHLEGRKNLFEVLSMAGGLKPDAGYSVKITRRTEFGAIPLAGAVPDPTGLYSVATVNLKSVMDARNPEENILICPFDVISVPKGELVYVIGDVRKSGGFILSEQETITVLQVLARAEGLEKTAKPESAKILRAVAGNSTRSEIPVDLKMVLAGQANDVALQTDDILFVPGTKKGALLQTLATALSIGASSTIIWRGY